MKGLHNQIAIITGATGLIGNAIVQRLLGEGTTVIATSRDTKKIETWAQKQKTDSNKLIPVTLDLRESKSINTTYKYIRKHVGIPTILIANASARENLDIPMEKLSHKDFYDLLDTDIAGHFLLARELVNGKETMASSIVFLSSVYANAGVDQSIYPTNTSPTPIQYATIKGGMVSMVRTLAAKWGENATRVNAIIAGGVRSPERQSEEFVEKYARRTMLNRMAMPEEVASAAAFLASEEASYITGSCLTVDGGFTAW